MTPEQIAALDQLQEQLLEVLTAAGLSGLLTWGQVAFVLCYSAERAEWLERVANGYRPWWVAA